MHIWPKPESDWMLLSDTNILFFQVESTTSCERVYGVTASKPMRWAVSPVGRGKWPVEWLVLLRLKQSNVHQLFKLHSDDSIHTFSLSELLYFSPQ